MINFKNFKFGKKLNLNLRIMINANIEKYQISQIWKKNIIEN